MRALIASVAIFMAVSSVPARAVDTWDEWRFLATSRLACNLVLPFVPGAPPGGARAFVKFLVRKDGRVGEPIIAHSSGVSAYDSAALTAVKLSSPLPRPPNREETLSVTLPVRFTPPRFPYGGPPAGRSPCRMIFYIG